MVIVVLILVLVILYLLYDSYKLSKKTTKIISSLDTFFFDNMYGILGIVKEEVEKRKMLENYINIFVNYTAKTTENIEEYQNRLINLYKVFDQHPSFDNNGVLTEESYKNLVDQVISKYRNTEFYTEEKPDLL